MVPIRAVGRVTGHEDRRSIFERHANTRDSASVSFITSPSVPTIRFLGDMPLPGAPTIGESSSDTQYTRLPVTPIEPVVFDNSGLSRKGAGEQHAMARAGDRVGVAVMALGVERPLIEHATEEAVGRELSLHPFEIFVGKLVDAHGHDQLRRAAWAEAMVRARNVNKLSTNKRTTKDSGQDHDAGKAGV